MTSLRAYSCLIIAQYLGSTRNPHWAAAVPGEANRITVFFLQKKNCRNEKSGTKGRERERDELDAIKERLAEATCAISRGEEGEIAINKEEERKDESIPKGEREKGQVAHLGGTNRIKDLFSSLSLFSPLMTQRRTFLERVRDNNRCARRNLQWGEGGRKRERERE